MVSKVSVTSDTLGEDEAVEETTTKNQVGRPTLYKEDYPKQAYRLCLLGATDEEIAEAFGVTEATIAS